MGIGGQTVVVGRPKQRALLAVLALSPGTCVSRTRLVDELWGEAPPESATHALQVHVSALRKLLGPGAIATCPGGYKLDVPAEAVDARRAESLLAAGDAEAALALFRGTPLEGVELEGPAAHEAQRLDDLRAEALETRFERALDAGEGAAFVSRIERLVADHPLRERPRGQLMRALHQAGRTADALAAFQAARRTFVDQLGLEPSPALRELERAILNDELPVPARPAAAAAPVTGSRKRRIALALALAALATAAGVIASIMLPTSNPSAATRETVSSPVSAPATVVAAPTPVAHTVSHTPRRRVAHHPAMRAHAVPKRHAVRRHAVTPRKTVTTQAPAPAPAPAPTTTHAVAPAPRPAPVTTAPAPKVVTHPVSTAPAPTTTAPAPLPTGPIQIVDTFDDPLASAPKWQIWVRGSGPTITPRNGKLLIQIPAGSQPGGGDSMPNVSAQYATQQCFAGDIDAQVDYTLLQWPMRSSAWVSLSLPNGPGMVERMAAADGNDEVASWLDPTMKWAPATGMSGSLRLTRINGIVTTYYLADGAWVKLDSAPSNAPTWIAIGLSFNKNVVPLYDVSVALDNFSVKGSRPNAC